MCNAMGFLNSSVNGIPGTVIQRLCICNDSLHVTVFHCIWNAMNGCELRRFIACDNTIQSPDIYKMISNKHKKGKYEKFWRREDRSEWSKMWALMKNCSQRYLRCLPMMSITKMHMWLWRNYVNTTSKASHYSYSQINSAWLPLSWRDSINLLLCTALTILLWI